MLNKKAQLLAPIEITIGIVIAIIIGILIIFGGSLVFLSLNKFQVAGIVIAIMGMIYAVKPALSSNLTNKKIALILIIFMFAGVMFVLPYMGIISNTSYATMDGYFESPFFATLSCEPAAGSKSTSGTIEVGDSWTSLDCPLNTKECDILFSSPQRPWYSGYKQWIEYKTCLKGTSQCSSNYRYPPNVDDTIPQSGVIDQLLLPNMPSSKELQLRFRQTCISHPIDSCPSDYKGSLKTQYISYVLYVQDSLNGGKNPISESVDCKLPNNYDILNKYITSSTVKDSSGKILQNSENPDNIIMRGYLQTDEYFNYISGTVTRTLLGNSLTYEGQLAYCQDQIQGQTGAMIYKIGTIETNTYKYNIVDKNSPLTTAGQIDCCNQGQIRLNQVCKDFKWQTIIIDSNGNTNTECDMSKPCPDGRLSLDNQRSFTYKCINNYCQVSDIRKEECSVTANCKTDEVCINFKCQKTSIQPGSRPSNESQGGEDGINLDCNKLFEYQTTTNQINKEWYNYIGIGKPTITPVPVCKVKPSFIFIVISIILVLFVVVIVLLLKTPKKGSKKKR